MSVLLGNVHFVVVLIFWFWCMHAKLWYFWGDILQLWCSHTQLQKSRGPRLCYEARDHERTTSIAIGMAVMVGIELE